MTQPNDSAQPQQQSEPEAEALYLSICSAISALPPTQWWERWLDVDWEAIYSTYFPDYDTFLEWLAAHRLPEERLNEAFPKCDDFVTWLIAHNLLVYSNVFGDEETEQFWIEQKQETLLKKTTLGSRKNHWISSRDRTFGSWWAEFTDRKMLDRQRQLEFYLKFLEAGERERLLVVKHTLAEQPFPYDESMGISYSQHLRQVAPNREEHFLDGIYGDPWETVITSPLCYYDLDGRLVEGEVGSIGALLGELRDADREYSWRGKEFYSNRPIRINYDWHNPGYEGDEPALVLGVALDTDIWYPEVEGFLDQQVKEQTGVYPLDDITDNLELARCHTPRFNRFLAEFKQLTLEFGGEWKFEYDANEDGIVIP